MNLKDYYQILEIPSDASEDEIKKAYRRMAFKCHPDRNPGDPHAEARFKEISEAYGVLIDPIKRSHYDQWQKTDSRGTGEGFRYSQEEIFQDLFRDPRFNQIFQDLFREFERNGLRFDQHFFDRVFSGGGGIFFGGIFIFGPFGSARMRIPKTPKEKVGKISHDTGPDKGLLRRLGEKISGYLSGEKGNLTRGIENATSHSQDLSYRLTVNHEEAKRGTWVQVGIDHGDGRKMLRVKIPRGTRSGTRLRIKGKGIRQGDMSGDLYLIINIV